MIQSLEDQLKTREEFFDNQLKLKECQISDLIQEKVSLSTVINHGNMKVEELERVNNELQDELSSLQDKYEADQSFLHNELEKATEEMHEKLESVTLERQDYYKKYLDKEHENSQLMAFILSEGLQLPRLQKINY
jgi:chromosome segregation ATPase